jgi:hypothetical protein
MDVWRALGYVTSSPETCGPRDVPGAIGGLVVALMGGGEGAEIPELLALRNRLRTVETWDHSALEVARDSLWRVVAEIERRAEPAARCR